MFIYKYFAEKKLILTIFYSNVTAAELYNVIDELQVINSKENNLCGLTVLCKNVKPKNISISNVMDMGSKMQAICYKQDFKNAFITKTRLAFALVRIYKMVLDLVTKDEMEIFKKDELSKAMNWLDSPELEEEIGSIIEECENHCISNIT